MPLGRRVWGVGKLLLIVGGLAATFLLFFGLSMRVALRAREVRVPVLVGQTLADATRTLSDAGLGLRIDENRRPDARVAAGRVVQQDPRAGVEARQQRTVRVWISSGPPGTTVPPLVGQTERTARLRLAQDGLTVAAVSELRAADYPPDTVIGQDPAPMARASRVSLLINRAEQATTYVMPDVIGTDGGQAADVLRGHGFRVTIVGSQPYAGIPPGTVVRQQPAGGFQVGPADAISLEVSR